MVSLSPGLLQLVGSRVQGQGLEELSVDTVTLTDEEEASSWASLLQGSAGWYVRSPNYTELHCILHLNVLHFIALHHTSAYCTAAHLTTPLCTLPGGLSWRVKQVPEPGLEWPGQQGEGRWGLYTRENKI